MLKTAALEETSPAPVSVEAGVVGSSQSDPALHAPMLDDPALHDPTLHELARLLAGRRTLALTGAGISTESGIPDYRSPERLANPPTPMRYQDFVRSDAARRRYWARSLRGWPRVAQARPNAAHDSLARLGRAGLVGGVLTQNVDGLHQAAGSAGVLELHGTLHVVRCLGCKRLTPRRDLQARLLAANPELSAPAASPTLFPTLLPDGDAALPPEVEARFTVPGCLACGGVLKPDVVFFGENVPRPRLERAWAMLERADALLVLGSSLTVFSGYRFAARAAEMGLPVAIVTAGPTRGDPLAALKLGRRLGSALPSLERLLLGG